MKINPRKSHPIGTLYIVATPLGNLQDMSMRAVVTLQAVDYIAAEDTRHSLPLLQHFSIQTPLIAVHEHNERTRTNELLHYLQQGKSIALISDAGTPLISDPGFFLVREAHAQGIPVVPIPGPCAAIAALSAAGLPTNQFVFEGFLPTNNKQRLQRLEALREEVRTVIFYEAPHRILDFIQALRSTLGEERRAVIARELTKVFETIRSGTLAELEKWITHDANQARGEIVVLVEGAKKVAEEKYHTAQQVLRILLEQLPLKQAVEIAAKITQERKNELYKLALRLNDHKIS